MAIVEEDLERVRSTLALSDVIGEYVALKRVGRNWVGLCPFHAERTGSFNVRDETGRYRCFGCGASGDVFRFVQDVDNLDFVAAVEKLAAKAGIQLRYTTGGEGRERQRRKQLVEVVGKAVEWYHERLLDGARRPRRPRLPAPARAGRRRRPHVQARLGARLVGPAQPERSASTPSCCARPGWRSPTGPTASRTRSGRG